MMKIITRYDPKPIPTRQFDHSAYIDGEEESIVGYGATEEAAVAELKELIEEKEG